MVSPSTSLASEPAVWGRLAAVRRTVEWVSLTPQRGLRAPFVGANCVRLIDQALALLGEDAQVPEAVARARVALAELDGLPPDAREAALDQARAALDEVLPIEQAGATLLPIEVRARLVVPRRRRGGRGDTGPGAQRGGSGEGGEDAASDEAGSDEAAADEAAADEGSGASAVAAHDGAAELDLAPDADAPATDAPATTASRAGDGTRNERARRGPRPREEASLEELFEQARRDALSAGRARAPRAARVEEETQRQPFFSPERGERSLSELPGLHPDLVARLQDAGIETVADLLLLPPAATDRRALLRGDAETAEGEEMVMVRGPVLTRCTRLSPGLHRREVVLVGREGQRFVARWMGAPPRGFDAWDTGIEIALVGTASVEDVGPEGQAQVVLYEAETVGMDGRGSGWLACYDLPGIDDREIRDAVARALAEVMDQVRDTLPPPILDRHRLLPLDEALRDAHFPANTTGRGRSRLAFEELFLLQIGVALRAGRGRPERGLAHKALHTFLGQLELQHGITLDDGQESALAEIRRDLIRATPMTRLLQGDVGAGKGLVALMSAIIVAEGRTQVAMVCPDPLSAERRFLFAEGLLRSLGIAPILVSGPISHGQVDAMRRGEAHIVFGTTALLSEKVEWRKLGLVVVEERDRYGTVSPAQLRSRTPRPDLLVMTTAPIPASLTFSVFGEFDLSVVPRVNGNRATPRVFSGAERSQAYDLVREQVRAGHQAYVVFPVSGGRDLLGPEDARRFADALRKELPDETRIAVYASAMGRDERFRVVDDFAHRRVDVLVSTTYIEDAPAVANATVMVVEHADKHSLIRLHRLRGHLQHGTCAMVLGDQPSDEGRRLVDLAVQESDGFRLAEIDLKVRGVAELLGERATEAPTFAWADPPEDRALLLRARAEAFELVRSDPELRRYKGLPRAVQARWGDWLGDEDAPEAAAPAERAGTTAAGKRRRRRRRR